MESLAKLGVDLGDVADVLEDRAASLAQSWDDLVKSVKSSSKIPAGTSCPTVQSFRKRGSSDARSGVAGPKNISASRNWR